MKPFQLLKNILLFLFPVLLLGCDVFINDGGNSSQVGPGGFFYITDQTSNSIIMLDTQLKELKRWSLSVIAPDTSAQGLTFDGKNLWVSLAGNEDQLLQLDLSGDSLIVSKSLDAPPQKHGTVRGIAWDGNYLWVMNSGSSTYNLSPALYQINPASGAIMNGGGLGVPVPTASPRGLTYSKGYTDVYGRGISAGLYYTDKDKDKIFFYNNSIPVFDSLFSAIVPPRGTYYVYETGIAFDGQYFWIINSSSTADILYKVSYDGHEESRFDLPYSEPGSIAWASYDVRAGNPPQISGISPTSGALGENIVVDILGSGFRQGAGLSADFGSGITVNSLSYISGVELKADITISVTAPIGKRNLIITNPGGVTAKADSIFSVTALHTEPHLWIIVQDLASPTIDTLYQIRISDTSVVHKWSTATVSGQSTQGVTFDGTHFWMSVSGTDKRIYQVDTAGGTLTPSNPSATVGGTIRGLCWEANYLWAVSSDTSKGLGRIIRFDPAGGTILDTILAPGREPRGITFADGNLYCNDKDIDSVFVYNKLTQKWTSVFATPTPPGGTTSNRFATGLTWDGSNFWILNSTGNYDYIFKLSKTGALLMYFDAPRIGPGNPTGIVYTSN
jgi:streptogramin lyase